MQLSFFTLPVRARRADPATSHQAAASARELADRHVGIILATLKAHGALGKDGIAARSRLDGVAVCRRLGEMEQAGLIEQTGRTVKSTAGRLEREWRAVG